MQEDEPSLCIYPTDVMFERSLLQTRTAIWGQVREGLYSTEYKGYWSGVVHSL